jgi:hypothetical protein
MIRNVKRFFVMVLFVAAATPGGLQAQDPIPVTWDGGNGRWESANWTKEGVSGLTAADAMGDNTGGLGGYAISIGGGAIVEYDPNPGDMGGLGDFKPRMTNGPGSFTIKEGAVLTMDSHSDEDGRWMRVGMDITLDNGTLRRTHSGTSVSGGRIIFGYRNELLPNEKININVINGGRIENDAKMVFGDPNLPPAEGHNPGIEVAMTINNGTLDLTGGADFPEFFGLADGELVFFYEYEQGGVGPKNEKYSINFTGPGTIIIDNGIFVAEESEAGEFSALGGAPDLTTPITYQDLWGLGILQANGQSGKTGANFSTYFTTTGTVGEDNYTLTSLLAAAGVAGDYNDNGIVDAADYVLWRNGGPLENEVEDPGTPSAADYNAWRARFGNGSGGGAALSASAAVPEPATLVCLLIAVAGLLPCRPTR